MPRMSIRNFERSHNAGELQPTIPSVSSTIPTSGPSEPYTVIGKQFFVMRNVLLESGSSDRSTATTKRFGENESDGGRRQDVVTGP